MTNLPDVSVFIVNYNMRDHLEQCLNALLHLDGSYRIEIFIADNDSVDGSASMIADKFPQTNITRFPRNVGYTRALNHMLRHRQGRYSLLLHPDVIIRPDLIKQFLVFFETHPLAGILGGNLYYPDGTPNPCEVLFPSFRNDLSCFVYRLLQKIPGGRRFENHCSILEWSHHSTAKVNWVWNACMMIREDVFEEIGLFDENFFVWYADWDFCKRAEDNGWHSYYLHPAGAIHYESQSYANCSLPTEAVRYKVDGWQSAAPMILDRYTFVKKHCAQSLPGIKLVDILQNTLRFWHVLSKNITKQCSLCDMLLTTKTYLRIIRAILRGPARENRRE